MPFHGVIAAMPDSIGNTLNDAQSIIIGTATKRFSDSVEFGDNDYFRFTLNSSSGFSLTLFGLSANADVEILNSSGNLVTSNTVPLRSTNEGTLTESINAILDAGTYFIRVFPGPPADPANPAGTTPSTNYTLDVRADNGITNEIVWRYYAANVATNGIWRFDGTTFLSGEALNPSTPDALWAIVGTGDFNNDNSYDLLWRYYGTLPELQGVNGIWLLDNGTLTTFFALNPDPDLSWQIRGVGNFDGGIGKPDIIWHNPTTGAIRVWFLDDAYQTTAVTFLDRGLTGWELQAVGDFNGDGNTDLVWRSGALNGIWYLNGTNFVSAELIIQEFDTNKQIQGAGDFNSDGSPDLLWRNFATGENEIWLMEGTSRTSIVPLPTVFDPAWRAITPFERRDPVALADLAGNQIPTAFRIGPLNGSGVYRDAIAVGDADDFYQFSLGSQTRLNLTLDGYGTNSLLGNLNVQILSGTGVVISQSVNGGTSPETIANLDLNPGTYFIRVFAGDAGAASPYDLNLSVNNLPVLVSSGPLTVSEGQTQTLSNTLLLVTDGNDPANRLTYTYVSTFQNGNLLSNGQALIANSTFTQADINAGRIAYQQNGGEGALDTFVFAVSDGRGGTIPNTTFTVNVTPVNDPPVLVSLSPITVSENSLVTLSNTSLLVTDVEQTPSQLVYSLNSLPVNGTLSFLTGPVLGPLTLGSQFTQADINSGRIGYRQNGSETTADRFTFTVTDGAGGFLNPQIQTLSINITPVNDPPVLVTNVPLTVSQAGPNIISTAFLSATDAELTTPAQQDQIIFSVTQLPTQGTLFLGGTAITTPFTFSQADLNAGVLTYAQSGTPVNSDRFNFRLSDGTATVPATGDFTYEIFVQRVAGPPVLATIAPLTASEGVATVINSTLLQVTDPDSAPPFITYSLASLPSVGSILKAGTALTVGQTFTQADIDQGRIAYLQNGSEQPTFNDAFTFTFTDERGQGPATTRTFSISILPVNDLPTILTPTPQATVTEGFGIDITAGLLNATDPDNLPSQLTYQIISAPTNGSLVRSGTVVTSFTQADINGGQIKYLQDGTESTADAFTFTVTDLSGTPVGPNTFNINVIPFNDPPGLAVFNPITLDEGETYTFSSITDLQITDIDGPGPLTYTVGTLPANGVLRVGNLTLTSGGVFSQADINNGQLFYIHNGSETTSDRFTFTASDGATTGLGAPGLLGTRTLSINVLPVNDSPLLTSNNILTLSEGATGSIRNTLLSAFDPDNLPAQLTYTLSAPPAYGTLLSAGTAVTSFTQAALNANQISYQHNGSETTLDSFIFDVSDGSASLPGGSATFTIAITPVNDSPTLLSNAGLTLDEGGTGAIPDTVLLVTDPDGPSPSVIFTLGAAPAQGVLLNNTVTLSAGQTFTQADISNGLLSYIHNGSETTSDRFTFTASDGSTGVLSLRTFSITVNPVNDSPIITIPTTSASTVSVDEDVTFTFAGANRVSITDVDGGPTFNASFSTSNGGTLNLSATPGLTNNNSSNVTYTGPLSGLNTALNNFRYTGVQNFNGVELLTISVSDGNGGVDTKTITINVVPVNDAPTLTLPSSSITINEDTPTTALGLLVNDVDADVNPLRVTLSATNGALTVNDNGALTFLSGTANGGSSVIFTGTLPDIQTALSGLVYQGRQDYFGSDRIIVTVDDQGATGRPGPLSVTRTISVNVLSVNDKPTFTGGADQFVVEDSGQQIIPNWATNISRGAANEASQSIGFAITSSNPTLLSELFTSTPSISPTTGNLTFTPRADANGTIQLTAVLQDNGGTANGGNDTSDPFIFTIAVGQRNDAPTFVRGSNVTINEDPDPGNGNTVVISNWATNIRPGPLTPAANEISQGLNFLIDTNNPALFAAPPTITISGPAGNQVGALTFAPNPNANGTAVVTVRLQDDGGTNFGGQDTSPPQTFTIVVRPVNDAPTFTPLVTTSIDILEDAPQQAIQFATDILAGPPNESSQTVSFLLSNSNPSLFAATNGGIAPTIDPSTGILTFRPATNAFGSAVLTATLRDNGGTTNGGIDSSVPYVFTINVLPVNDAPSFTRGANQTVNEDAPAQTIVNWATGISPGPNEAGQVVAFQVSNDNNALFSVQPTISSTGTLTYTPAPNAFGTATVTVSLVDNGGTANGGVDTSAPQIFTIIVNPVNDAPTLTLPSAQVTAEDTPINFTGPIGIFLTDIDSGSNPIDVTFRVNNGTINLPSTNGLTVSSGANGSSSVTFRGTVSDLIAAIASVVYTPNSNFSGSDTLTVTVNDRGFFGSGGARTAVGTVGITITAVNDPPELVTLNSLLLEEGGNRTISNSLLRTTDTDNTAAQLIYTLVSLPSSGVLRLQSGATFTTIGLNGTFTQADIDANRLNYLHNGSETTSDSFSFRVSDGQITLSDSIFNINIIPVNDAPGLSVNAPLTLSEGEISTISSSLLQFTDNDNTSAQLTYTITSAPINGTLRLGGTDLTQGSTFTQEQLNSSLLTYEHNGNETTADGFNFSLGDGTTSVPGSFNISVIPVNDIPSVISSGPLTVNEGASVPVLSTVLNTTDPDNPPTQVVYTLAGGPGFGTLLLNSTTTLTNGSTFTQAQINSGAITYRHNGSENLSDAFFFNVSDGQAAPTSGIVNINVNPVNDAPVLVRNTGLTLPVGVPSSRAISNSQLFATDVDNTVGQILYRLTVLPSAGTLRLGTGALAVGQTFSQQDINQGRVVYQYSGTGTSDGFQFALVDTNGGAGGTGFFQISFTS